MMLDQITPVILTRDEEPNIARTLGQLDWAKEIVVVDSFSTDRTVEIARSFPNVRLFQREIDSIAGQSIFGLQQASTPWVLLLDADYFVPRELTEEISRLSAGEPVDGYIAPFSYAVGGRLLRASLYPPRLVLMRRDRVRIRQDGHTPRFAVDTATPRLATPLIHDDRKGFRRFLDRQRRYMRQEAEKLRATPARELPLSGRIRRLVVVAPLAVVLHTLFVKGVILDGWPGLVYTWERFLAELILARELVRR